MDISKLIKIIERCSQTIAKCEKGIKECDKVRERYEKEIANARDIVRQTTELLNDAVAVSRMTKEKDTIQ